MEATTLELPNLKKQIAPYENVFIETIEKLHELLLSDLAKFEIKFLPAESIPIKKIWRHEQICYSFDIIPESKYTARMMHVIVSMEGKVYFELLQDGNEFLRATINWRTVHGSELKNHHTLATNFEEWIDVQTMFEITESIADFFKQ
jgi:hypothetical protein